MKTRFFRSLLCCCIVLAALTAGVLAADDSTVPTQVVVGGTDVTKGGCWTVDGDGVLTLGGKTSDPGTVTYDPASSTLTLHGVQLQRPCIDESSAFHEDAAVFAQGGGLTLILKGKNAVDGCMVANGVYVRDGDLTVTGDGELEMTLIQPRSFRYGTYGLYSTRDITIRGGTLNFAGAVESADCIYADNAVTVTGGTIILGVRDHADGIHTNHLVVEGGVGSRRFGPEEPASRAMIVTILWRQAGSPQVNYAMRFDDVPNDAWYTEAVRWAVSERIVSGYDDRTFGPGDPVTREQMAVVLYRCAAKAGLDTATQSLTAFGDRDQVSPYAREAVAWAVGVQLLGGVRPDTLAPQGQTTRAQTAAILLRYGSLEA